MAKNKPNIVKDFIFESGNFATVAGGIGMQAHKIVEFIFNGNFIQAVF